jgi:hypothetical protein
MKNNKITNLEGLSYETPSVTSLDILSEGVLCGSFRANEIDDAEEFDWGTL